MIFDCFGLFVRTRLRWKDARAEMFTRNFILSPFRFLLCVPASASLTMMKTTRESGRKDGTRNFFNKISSRSSVAVYAWSTRGKKRNKLSSLIQIQSELIFRQEKYLLAISSEEKNFFHIETFYHTGARAKIIIIHNGNENIMILLMGIDSMKLRELIVHEICFRWKRRTGNNGKQIFKWFITNTKLEALFLQQIFPQHLFALKQSLGALEHIAAV